MDGEQAVWREIRGLDARLTRLEAREVPTSREMDAAITDSRHKERNYLTGVIGELQLEVKDLEDRMNKTDVWQAKQSLKLGIIVALASILGTGLVQFAVRVLAR